MASQYNSEQCVHRSKTTKSSPCQNNTRSELIIATVITGSEWTFTNIPYIRHTDVLDNLTDSEGGNRSIDVTQTTKEGGGELIYSRYLLKHGNNLFFYMSPVLFISENVGNFISIVILCSAYFRKSPSSLIMIVLALMDTGNLNTGLLGLWFDMK